MNQELIIALAKMARRAPDEWQEFKTAFRIYEAFAKNNLVLAQGDLQKFQGMALQCQLLTVAFDDALAAADRIATRQQAAPVRN